MKIDFKNLFFRWLPLVLWMGLIFYLSSLKGSGSSYYDLVSFIERKGAHILEYLVLTFLFFRALKKFNIPSINFDIYLFIFPLAYAFSDELHQLFVFGREGRLRDVLIDFIGIIVAWVAIKKIVWLRKFLAG